MSPAISLSIDDRWLPKSILCLRDYSVQKFTHDVVAGVTVGLVALPLAMAFAIASGLTPQAGIYCAVITGFLISALGGSKAQIGGPTGAFVVVVAGIIAAHGVDGLFMCTMMAGVLLVVLGATGMGSAVKFIPRPVVLGFTNGIAVLIASTQIKDFFGLKLEKVPGEFWLRMKALAAEFPTWSWRATLLAAATLAVLLVCRAISGRIPGPIIAMFGATVAAAAFRLPVETIGSRFGGIPAGLPHIALPHFRADLIHGLLGPAFTVAMLGAIESLMSAMVAVTDLWWTSRYWRHRSHSHQHPRWSANSRRGNDSCVHLAPDPSVCCSPGQLHPDGSTRGDFDGGRLQHGRVA